MATLKEERKLWKKGYKMVACLDEAGRGPLAGPVVAAAVFIIPNSTTAFFQQAGLPSFYSRAAAEFIIPKLKDSKKLSAKKREQFYEILTKNQSIKWGIGKVSEKVIDKINILEATKLAMIRALHNLEKRSVRKSHDREIFTQPDFLILDGNMKINLPILQKSIIKADEKVFSCAAASIIAKVTRDRIMEKYHKKYSRYGFDKHKGYPTKLHRRLLKKYGRCKIHRKSFKISY